MSRILVTGTRTPVALDLARSLRAQGHVVFGCDVIRTALFGEGMTYRSPRLDPAGFAADAARIVQMVKPDLIIPLCEEIYYWAHLRRYPLFAPDIDTLMRLHSKYDFAQFAAGLGLHVPVTERTGAWAPDRVFKPEFSRFGVRVLITPAQGPEGDDPANPWLRQAYVDGEDLCFYAIARQGRLRAFGAYRSAWRTKGGASYYFDPVEGELSARMQVIAATLATALDLTGQIACDLRRDAAGALWLLECNPRATSGLHLLAHDPAGLARALLGEGGLLTAGPQPVCLGLAMEVYGWPQAVRQGRVDVWKRDLRRARDVLAGRRLEAIADSVAFGLKAVVRGQGLAEYLTRDIACNGRLT